MSIFGSFKGGVHPPGHKESTESKAIEAMPVPTRVILPLQQHTGAPCEPVVAVGAEVAEGQKIGEAKGYVSSAIHASISGTVTAIENLPHPVIPRAVRAVVIENKAAAPVPAKWEKTADWAGLSAKELLDRISGAGIVGLGGAAFPTHVKLSPPPGSKLDTLIINGVECEPYLTADHRLMVERTAEILEGVRILLKVLGISSVYMGIESNKPDAIRIVGEQVAKVQWGGAKVAVVPLKVKYPQGSEKQLIKALVGREVPSGGLPFQVGVIVQNVGTAFAVFEAVTKGKPLIERVLTVTGNRIREPKNLLVRIGTPFSKVIEHAGGIVEGARPLKVIMGGPMMGIAQYTMEVPVLKGTSGILVLEESRPRKTYPCVKCGTCVEVCPMNLMPCRLAEFSDRGDFAGCDEYHVRDCMECGACTYACISNRPIVHLIKYAKMNLAKAAKK